MQNIIGKILVVFVVVTGGLLIYKTMRVYSAKQPVLVEVIENKLSNAICEEEKVKEIIKEYLISTPEVILQSIEGLQKRKVEENQAKVNNYIKDNKADLETDENFPVIGDKNADIAIVVFFDYNCSYCKKGDRVLEQLLKQDSDVKIIFRPLPILSDASEYVAKVSLSVFKTDTSKFKTIHNTLMEMQHITKESVETLLANHDLNIVEIDEMVDSKEIKDLIDQDIKLARNLKMQGVPVYIINGRVIPGLVNLKELEAIIKEIKNNKS